jgi:hypothetical protein
MSATASTTVKRMLRTRGALAAAVTAVGLGVFIVIKDLALNAVSLFGIPPEQLGDYSWLNYFGLGVLTSVVPFVIGFFLSLWVVAPVAEALGLGHVISRSALAVGIGSTLAFIVRAIANIVSSITFDRPFLADSFPELGFGPGIPDLLGQALQGGLVLFISLLPLGVLAGILLWHWRTAHPPEYHVEGLVDV